ncbi:hypothetical protein [Streptomyces sp. NPDC007905]|uniref:hypothetical protein n=1 Tax=Streptomyces sp. NPDC007905 TaxID=3364788 RepID=UPI0036E4F7C8
MAEASSGGQPVPDGDDSTPAPLSDGAAPANTASQNQASATHDDDAPADPTVPAPTWAEIGRGVGATITVIAALGGLILGVRAEQRADREEQRGDQQDQRAAELTQKAFAEQVDFYRTTSAVVVMNGNPHPMRMRLVLPKKNMWWDLYVLQPCKQIKILNDVLRASMRKALPSVQVTDGELSSLWLEFRDPKGRSWVRSSSGGALVSSAWKARRGANWVDLGETWNKAPEDSPMCGAP